MSNTVLELHKERFFPELFANDLIESRRVSATSHRFASFLWQNIDSGADEERGSWDAVTWQNHLANPMKEFYAVYCDGEPAGCFEISRAVRLMQPKGGVAQVTALGLLPEFVGEGLGAALVTRVVEKALATGASRVTIRGPESVPPGLQRLFRSQGFLTPR